MDHGVTTGFIHALAQFWPPDEPIIVTPGKPLRRSLNHD